VVLGHHRGVNATVVQAFEVPFAHVWTMKDGLAIRFRSYVDTALLRGALSVDA
jgi:ketosteroid isomerase-like protein